MLDDVLSACYFGMCQISPFIEVWNVHLHVFMRVCAVFACLSYAWRTSKSIRACWGCSCTTLCFKYESYSRYRCPPGSVRWNGMKSTAVVTAKLLCLASFLTLTNTNIHTTHTHTNNHKIRQGDPYFHMQILRVKATLLLACLFAFFSCGWLSHLPGNQMMASRHLMLRHTLYKSPCAWIQQF